MVIWSYMVLLDLFYNNYIFFVMTFFLLAVKGLTINHSFSFLEGFARYTNDTLSLSLLCLISFAVLIELLEF